MNFVAFVHISDAGNITGGNLKLPAVIIFLFNTFQSLDFSGAEGMNLSCNKEAAHLREIVCLLFLDSYQVRAAQPLREVTEPFRNLTLCDPRAGETSTIELSPGMPLLGIQPMTRNKYTTMFLWGRL